MQNFKPRVLALAGGLIALGVALDQWTKAWAQARLPGRPITVIPDALSLVYVENHNAAFGLGGFLPEAWKTPVLLALTIGLTGVLLYAFATSPDRASRIGFGVTIAGALGNIIDRLRLGHVVDFIYWHGGFSWPNFNVADVLVCTGVGVLLVFGGRAAKKSKQPAAA